jgi:hypothetical protein
MPSPPRRAFTRSDLLIALPILFICLFITLLFTGCSHRASQIEEQRADFQSIAAGLEAYKADFGDYPRNPALAAWNTHGGAQPAPFYPSLATALIGPGPAATTNARGGDADFQQFGDGHDGPGFCTTPGGKVWGPYVSPVNFKCVFISSAIPAGGSGAQLPAAGRPVILDRWGQVIQYFPRYGPISNRLPDSTLAGQFSQSQPIAAGPLFGYCQPKSVDSESGQNCFFDWRDGAVFFSTSASDAGWNEPNPITNATDYAQPWPDPTTSATTFHPELAMQWMLGDAGSGGQFQNAIPAPQTLKYAGPYILVSAGPDGPDRPNGGFCNFADASGKPIANNNLQAIFLQSGNLFNFSPP